MFNQRSSTAGGCRGRFPSHAGRWRRVGVGVGLSLLAGSAGGTRNRPKPNSRTFPQRPFAWLALNEFCRVAGSPGQAFLPPVLSSQGTAGDRGGGRFPVFPFQARGRRKPQGCGKHTCSGVCRRAAFGELSACAGVSEGWREAAALFVWEGAS